MRLNILAFAAGILYLQMQPELPAWGAWLAAGMGLALPCLVWRNQATRALAVLACLALGVGWATWRAEIRLADHLGAEWEGRDVVVVGVVAGLPQDFSGGVRFEFDVENAGGAVVPGRVMLSWYQGRRERERTPPLAVRPGERWRFTVRLKQPHGNANPGVFDYEAWLFERGLRATGYIRPGTGERLAEFVPQPWRYVERWRERLRQQMQAQLPAADYPAAGILVALAIGDQRSIGAAEWQVFSRTGTTHLMSISGLHVTMLAALVGGMLAAVWRRLPW